MVMKRETISAIDLLTFPRSSLTVIGLPSFILSRAAGQSRRYFFVKASTVWNFSLMSLKAALN